MKTPWNRIEEALKEVVPTEQLSSDEDFWGDFRARASLVNQEAPSEVGRPAASRIRWSPALAVAAACAVVAIMVAGVTVFYDAAHDGPSVVAYVEVIASHSGVLIMNDDDTEGTILWVVDMELADESGDNI
jgi:anti-sigma-K factor RskA